MRGMLRALNGASNRHAGKLFLLGLAGVCGYNWRQWQRDKARLAALGEPVPVPPLEEWPALPRVSALVAAWNEAELIEAHIESFLGLRYPDKGLVICAGGEDGTYELAQRYAGPGVTVLEQQAGEGKQGALRRCLARASGEVIYLTDADCLVDDEAFERTLALVVNRGEEAATGTWRPLDRRAAHPLVQFQWGHHLYRELWMPDYAPALDGRNAAVRREALERARAFEIEAPIGTDYVQSRALAASGTRIGFARGSRVQTAYPETTGAYLRQRSRWFRNPVVLGWRHGDWGQIRSHLWAGGAAVFLLGAPLAGWGGSQAVRAAWLAGAAHLGLAAARVTRGMERALGWQWEAPRYARLPAYLLVGWVATGWGLAETLRPGRRLRW